MRGKIKVKLLVCENARVRYKPQAEKIFTLVQNMPKCTDIREFVKSACGFKYGTVPMKILAYQFTPMEDD